MLPDIASIKKMRLGLGMTQKALAAASAISQSTIAKIESGRLDPSFSRAKRIFEALDGIARKGEKQARNVMNPRVVTILGKRPVSEAIRSMRHLQISQLPVLDDNGRIIGSISEKSVLARLEEGGFHPSRIKVFRLMDDAFPTVGENTSLQTIAHILRDSLAVIVLKSNHIAGIITKSDLLKSV